MAREKFVRKTNTTILLLVEGETEHIYFSQMKSLEQFLGVTVSPKIAKYSDPSHIITQALKENSEGIYDHIWCVFDCDVLKEVPKQFNSLRARAQKAGICFAESFPCFELWFLLHYSDPQRQYPDQDGLIRELKKYMKDYSKEMAWLRKKNIYAVLKPFQAGAISRGCAVQAAHGTDTDCSTTSVHELVTMLLEIQKPRE